MKTFEQWHEENAKHMEPVDIVAWCAEAWMAGFDAAKQHNVQQEEVMSAQDMNKFKVEHPESNQRGQRLYQFPNGYGASVVANGYGSRDGLLELAVIKWGDDGKFALVYDTPITSDVLGYLTEEQVRKELASIAALEGK